jgi:hypothetical protein
VSDVSGAGLNSSHGSVHSLSKSASGASLVKSANGASLSNRKPCKYIASLNKVVRGPDRVLLHPAQDLPRPREKFFFITIFLSATMLHYSIEILTLMCIMPFLYKKNLTVMTSVVYGP